MSIPGLKQITKAFVRRTFFAQSVQFVGGDTAHECVPLLESLCAKNKGTLFAYSVEVDEAEATSGGSKKSVLIYKQIVQEMIGSIDVAADFKDQRASRSSFTAGRRTWVAVKLSALLPDAQSLANLSVYLTKVHLAQSAITFPRYPRASDLDCLTSDQIKGETPLTEQDIYDIKDLHLDLVKICSHAQENLEYLEQSLKDAKAGNYALEVKLVHGTYHLHEMIAHETATFGHNNTSLSISPDPHPPIWPTKPETNMC
ncbi:hypothetical protein EW146_g3836 [Bondarzewia mesenterica]|uniref:Proline dehydrogenase n=1 Tax=Bondarzewia mesenterica TaxID=1095465 RepID=A0A4S4LYH6_9AGAM|nr:hypothetical protein EW146_g3836 [Bondarzewia mesenterica]